MAIILSEVHVREVMVHNDHKLINYKASEKHEEIMMLILNCTQSDAVIGQEPTTDCRKIQANERNLCYWVEGQNLNLENKGSFSI